VLVHRPTFCTFLSASPVRAFYPALGQPLQRRSTPEHTTLFAQDRP